jgi:hypothetical protein
MRSAKLKRPTMQLLLGFLGPLRGAYLGSMLGTALVRTIERMFIAYVIKLFVDSIWVRCATRSSFGSFSC